MKLIEQLFPISIATIKSDDPLVLRTCYPAMRHTEGDVIRTRDCVLLKANEENELPYVAKVAHLWENPEDGKKYRNFRNKIEFFY